MNFLFWFD